MPQWNVSAKAFHRAGKGQTETKNKAITTTLWPYLGLLGQEPVFGLQTGDARKVFCVGGDDDEPVA